MSPQPIDAQSLIGRIAAADGAQQKAERQPIVQQERLAAQTPAQSTQEETQVQDADETEHAPVREKKRKEPFSGRRRRRQKKKASDKPDSTEELVSSEPATYNPHTGKETPADDEGSVLDLEA